MLCNHLQPQPNHRRSTFNFNKKLNFFHFQSLMILLVSGGVEFPGDFRRRARHVCQEGAAEGGNEGVHIYLCKCRQVSPSVAKCRQVSASVGKCRQASPSVAKRRQVSARAVCRMESVQRSSVQTNFVFNGIPYYGFRYMNSVKSYFRRNIC